MAKYKVLRTFKDKYTKEVYKEGQEIEMTVKRADEAAENLKKWDGDFLERIDDKEDDPEKDKKGEKKEKGEGK